jgi:formate-dependent nitrite reductase membrane component NrfD
VNNPIEPKPERAIETSHDSATFSRTIREVNNADPQWRKVAYWLVIISFFSIPAVVMTLHLYYIGTQNPELSVHRGEFGYVWTFHTTLGIILTAMLGLNSWDKRTINGRIEKPPPSRRTED